MTGTVGPLLKGLAFAVVTLLATVVLGLAIANQGDALTTSYRARFTDATSVNAGDDVRMSGVRIGQVDGVKIVDRRYAEITFSVNRDRKLPAGVTAALKFRNLIGQRYLSLDPGTGDLSAVLPPDGLIPLERTRPALDLTAMFNGFKPLFQALSPQDVNKLSGEIVQVLQGEGGTVDDLVKQTGQLARSLADKDAVIGQVIDNLNTVLDQVNARSGKLGGLVTSTQQLVTGLANERQPLGAAIDGLGALTTSTAGLLDQGRAPLKDDIAQLGALASNLNQGTPVFESFLAKLPVKYEAIGRTASYGSWLNLYLCSATSNAQPAPGGGPVGVPLTAARCHR